MPEKVWESDVRRKVNPLLKATPEAYKGPEGLQRLVKAAALNKEEIRLLRTTTPNKFKDQWGWDAKSVVKHLFNQDPKKYKGRGRDQVLADEVGVGQTCVRTFFTKQERLDHKWVGEQLPAKPKYVKQISQKLKKAVEKQLEHPLAPRILELLEKYRSRADIMDALGKEKKLTADMERSRIITLVYTLGNLRVRGHIDAYRAGRIAPEKKEAPPIKIPPTPRLPTTELTRPEVLLTTIIRELNTGLVPDPDTAKRLLKEDSELHVKMLTSKGIKNILELAKEDAELAELVKKWGLKP